MSNTIYTVGYSGLTPANVAAMVAAQGWMLVDVRIRPQSRMPQWNRRALESLMGARYVHVVEFGNKNYKGQFGAGIMLSDPEAGAARVLPLLEAQPIVLMCACKQHQECHRTDVAGVLQELTHAPITHLNLRQVLDLGKPGAAAPPAQEQRQFKPIGEEQLRLL